MTRRMRDLIKEHATQSFVGRRKEIAELRRLLASDGPFVTFVYGISGIGKTSLLARFADDARSQGATVVRLDCRHIEPSVRGFLAELGAAIGVELANADEAADRLGSLSPGVVLTLDNYELFRMMDTWIRRTFVPALGDNIRVFLFGREPPVAAWRVAPGWQGLFHSVRLDPLPSDDAIEFLKRVGVPKSTAIRIEKLVRGHPLALNLAAAALIERPELRLRDITSQHVVAEMTQLYLGDVPDPQTREALRAASVLRRTTRSLLGALLPETAPQDTFERLAALPFVERGSDGLIIHESVRHVIASALLAADPGQYRTYRTRAWRQLRREVRAADRTDLWRYTADMLYMIDEPIIREAFFPSDMQPYAADPAGVEDGATVATIIRSHEGSSAADSLLRLWQAAPDWFRVIRDPGGEVAGFYVVVEPTAADLSLIRSDPLLEKWWQHLQDDPLPDGQKALFCRRWLACDRGELPSPVQAACWLALKGLYMEMRSVLRRVYCTAINAESYGPVLVKLGFSLLPQAAVTLDGRTYHAAMLDFGPGLFNGWMASHVRAELGVEEDELLDLDARELVLHGRRQPLTPLEFALMTYLCDKEGKAISRTELLDQVWGYQYEGGSNVVDARIRALRKKLGDHAHLIETVAGYGYRFRRHC